MLDVLVAQRLSVSFLDYVYGDRKDRQSIVGRAALSGYGDLRTTKLAPGDDEVRLWEGFGLNLLEGVVLQRRKGRWTAVRLLAASERREKRTWIQTYAAPKDGWPAFWTKAQNLGLWWLPDDAELPQKDREMVLDGFSYVVETRCKGRYRAYAYSNPEFQKEWPEAKRMIAIGKLLEAEFPRPTTKSKSS